MAENSPPAPANGIDRRALLRIAVAGSALLSSSCSRTARAADISIAELGAKGDGGEDETATFQRAFDQMRGGGTLKVPAGTYLLSGVIVRNRNIRIELAPGALLRKHAPADSKLRGLFNLDGLIDAGFELTGGEIDLNSEGPMRIGAPGLIRNEYAHHVVPTLIGIAGPLNSAIFARRSSGIAVSNCSVSNSSENGLLFRNCGRISVRNCHFKNIANYGVEFSLLAPANDGGSGPMLARDDCEVIGCSFEDIDDYGLGSGNGCGVGGGGTTNLGGFRNYRITDCTFTRCQRDIHFELWNGSWIEQLEISRIRSADARQGSIGLVAARNSSISDIVIDDPGSAPTALLVPERPEIYGILLSTGASAITVRNVVIRDRRSDRLFAARGASITRGSNILRVSSEPFLPSDVGKWIGVVGANPAGTAYVGHITRVISPREVELDLPAGASVTGARFAVGGMIRNAIVLTASANIAFDNVQIDAGMASDPASAAEASAVRMRGMAGEVSFSRTTLRAPAGRSGQVGLRIAASSARLVGVDGLQVEGFARVVSRTP